MKEQQYILKNVKSFEPKHIFECGQCFRWNIQEDNSYTGVIKNCVLNVKKEKNDIKIKGICEENIKEICKDYFDLQTDYEKIRQTLGKIDNNLKISTEYGSGIRILHQDFWETLISFIISANNNIPRIKGIIERISQKYGREIIWKNKKYYTFPTAEELSKASISDLRKLGLGFRDKRVYETTRLYINKQINISNNNNTKQVREELLKLPGVGPKVADCIMLFSLKRYEVFPVDVWVNRVMNELYLNEIKNTKETSNKRKNNNIIKFANEKFGDLAGLAQQYLFYWRREN